MVVFSLSLALAMLLDVAAGGTGKGSGSSSGDDGPKGCAWWCDETSYCTQYKNDCGDCDMCEVTPAPPTNLDCIADCARDLRTWTVKCKWAQCGDCNQCKGATCIGNCAIDIRGWPEKCKWNTCKDCRECRPGATPTPKPATNPPTPSPVTPPNPSPTPMPSIPPSPAPTTTHPTPMPSIPPTPLPVFDPTESSSSQNGEEACEGHGYNEADCNAVGCCHYADQCYSSVGPCACDGSDGGQCEDGSSGEGESGEDACEGHGYDEDDCNDVGCCHYGDGECWSAVGPCACDGSDGGQCEDEGEGENGEEACEGHGYDEDDCNDVGCCHYGDGECWSAVSDGPCGNDDDDDDDDGSSSGEGENGEDACEGHDYDEDDCDAVGCCDYADGYCWSAVGDGPCSNAEFSVGDDDGMLSPCVDVTEDICASFCEVDGECCPSESVTMNTETFAWECCAGALVSDGGNPVCTSCADVMDPCDCLGNCGWSTSDPDNVCQSADDSHTNCAECPTMGDCDDTTCEEADCPDAYDSMRVCQCTSDCEDYGNCCEDADVCKTSDPCVDVDESTCASFCQVDGECCPSESLTMNPDFTWDCCRGVAVNDGGGNSVCTSCEDVTDPCECLGNCGWSTTNNACVSADESTTRCAECSTMSGCDSSTCTEAGCPWLYDDMRVCQCTEDCESRGNCCADADVCMTSNPCTDDSSCESFCSVDGTCCASEQTFMDTMDSSWKCCKGPVEDDEGNPTCQPLSNPCTDVTTDVCDSECQVFGECCPSENLLMDMTDFSWHCCAGPSILEDGMGKCTAGCFAVTDPCYCVGECGWSSSQNKCVAATDAETDCGECPTKGGCDDSTCEEAGCPMEYDSNRVCQCTENCAEFGNCCEDSDTCLADMGCFANVGSVTDSLICMMNTEEGTCGKGCQWLEKADCSSYTKLKNCPRDLCVWDKRGKACIDPTCRIGDSGAPVTKKACKNDRKIPCLLYNDECTDKADVVCADLNGNKRDCKAMESTGHCSWSGRTTWCTVIES